MARYIDADALLGKIPDDLPYKASVKRVLMQAPTEDVVPKREVEKWKDINQQLHKEMSERILEERKIARKLVARGILEEIEEEIVAALESNYQALQGWDDGRCNDYILEIVNRIKGKIDALRGIEGFIAELKKKYTEGGEG